MYTSYEASVNQQYAAFGDMHICEFKMWSQVEEFHFPREETTHQLLEKYLYKEEERRLVQLYISWKLQALDLFYQFKIYQ